MTSFVETLTGLAKQAQLELDPALPEQLAAHFRLLLAANKRFNLTTLTEPGEAAEKHYLDSLLLLPQLATLPAGSRLVDIGSGGGFPGLVLAAALPELSFTLLEATGKKALFLSDCAAELGLRNVLVLPLRAEQAGRDPALREQFAAATARAVAPLAVLLEYALPLLQVEGSFFAMKGAQYEAELQQAGPALDELAATLRTTHLAQLPQSKEQRAILELVKNAATAEKYPRRPGMPSKRPLGS